MRGSCWERLLLDWTLDDQVEREEWVGDTALRRTFQVDNLHQLRLVRIRSSFLLAFPYLMSRHGKQLTARDPYRGGCGTLQRVQMRIGGLRKTRKVQGMVQRRQMSSCSTTLAVYQEIMYRCQEPRRDPSIKWVRCGSDQERDVRRTMVTADLLTR